MMNCLSSRFGQKLKRCGWAVFAPFAAANSVQAIELQVIGSMNFGVFDDSAAEISAFDPATNLLFVTQASGTLQVVDLTDPNIPLPVGSFPVGPVNSVAISNGLLAVAIEADPKTDPGSIAVYEVADFTGETLAGILPINTFGAGALPDMVTFTPDGLKILAANEGEPNDDYTIDPEGSISIINLGDGSVSTIAGLDDTAVTHIDFNDYDALENHLRNKGVRISHPEASVSQDFEPEYITVAPDGSLAYVAMQENNALAVVDLSTDTIADIIALGTKNWAKGQPMLSVHEIPENLLPALGISTADDTTPVLMGGFSGLWYAADESTETNHVLYTHGDRGPNGSSFTENGIVNREFLLPDYQASIIRWEFNSETETFSAPTTIPLFRTDGTTPILGLPNIPGFDEQPLDGKGNPVPHDPFGGDLEGIVKAPNGTFWMVDEYRPAIYHFFGDGTLNARYVPQGTSTLGDTPQAPGFYGTETLPAEYSNRRSNRGFEAVAYDTDNDLVYAFIQTPMDNPDSGVRNADAIRILGINPADGTPVAEYVYLLERNAVDGTGLSRVDKIGDAVYAGNNRFYVLERDSSVDPLGKKFIFEIDLTGATNVLGQVYPNGETLEQQSAESLAALGIRPVFKSKVLNLASLGYLPSDKPEGLAVTPEGSLLVANDNDFTVNGYPTLAIGVIDFEPTELDASNRDSGIVFNSWPVHGMYMPDAIEAFEVNGATYILSANEGDGREYEGTPGWADETRAGDLNLDPVAYPDFATLQLDENLGRIVSLNTEGDIDDDGDIDRIHVMGARSFSVWDAFGNLVWDSGDFFEKHTAATLPDYFNSSDGNDSFDSRSDDKGPEPEGVVTGVVDGTPYAFIGLERIGGIMVYDMSDPSMPVFKQYINNRDFMAEDEFAGDIAPEGLVFVSSEDSPNGDPLLIVTNEVSGTLTVYGLYEPLPEGAYSIAILHNNDGESQLINAGSGLENYGGVARFVSVVRDQKRIAAANGVGVLTLSSGDNFLAGPEFNASFSTRGTPEEVYYDALALNAIGYDAIILGNHDFDFGPVVLSEFISAVDADVPFVSANLDFSAQPELAALETAGRLASSVQVTVETSEGPKIIAIIGGITPNLPFISSPGEVAVGNDVASAVQAEINANSDADLVIFVSHLQGVSEDVELISMVSGIDIAIAGGGDDLLANEGDLLLPGDEASDTYPIYAEAADGQVVPIVTTTGEYRYLGRLIVDIDAQGNMIGIGSRPIPVADISTGWPDAVRPDADVQTTVVDPVEAFVANLASNVIATNDVPLDGRRNSVRGTESSMGNLVADAMLWAAQVNADAFGAPVADIALVGGGGIRNGSILNEAGDADAPFTELDTFDILPFANFVSVVEGITPAQLLLQLETTFSKTGISGDIVAPRSVDGTGRYSQIAGLTVIYDPTAQDQILDVSGNEIIPGERIISAYLDDGTVLIANGEPVANAPSVNIVVTSFHAGGGDQYFWFLEDIPFTSVGLTYQQALSEYVQAPVPDGGLGGEITVADYGTVGERIQYPRDAFVFNWAPFAFNGWRVSDWMGALYVEFLRGVTPWVYSPILGWSILPEFVTSNSSVWIGSSTEGWVFTNAELYPHIYSDAAGEWFYVIGDNPSLGGEIFYRLSDGMMLDTLQP